MNAYVEILFSMPPATPGYAVKQRPFIHPPKPISHHHPFSSSETTAHLLLEVLVERFRHLLSAVAAVPSASFKLPVERASREEAYILRPVFDKTMGEEKYENRSIQRVNSFVHV